MKNVKITTNNGQTNIEQAAAMAAPSPTPLTGNDVVAAAMAKAMEKRENTLFAGQKKVLANSMRREMTNDPKKKVRYSQNALIESALAAYDANRGAVGKWTKDMKTILSAGNSAANEAFGDINPDDLADCMEIVQLPGQQAPVAADQ